MSMCRVTPHEYVLSGDKTEDTGRRGSKKDRIKKPFYRMQIIISLGSTVSITSMLYCIYRLILLLWV
ncbi:unnamed protein product [Staurois parvus]|uniref:Uncharacterized protein n=1 Tax=Staurois parvus TaxID=386267 RepID=A0ABN9ANT1_9NEOB|nr:unnamed protein product [Staurois parvus]